MGEDPAGGARRGDTADESGVSFVFDSTPLIHLVKAGLKRMIEGLEGEKYLPPSVYEEVVEVGKKKGFDDALVTEELVEIGVLKIKEPPRQLLDRINLHQDIHPGEAEALSLAKDLDGIAVTDDPVARAIADMHDVLREGSYMVILRMLNADKINKEKAKSSLRKLVDSGWRCDAELYENILRKIEEL